MLLYYRKLCLAEVPYETGDVLFWFKQKYKSVIAGVVN